MTPATPDIVMVADLPIGGGHPVAIQTMTTTPTTDIDATVHQAAMLFTTGADMVRLAVPDMASANSLPYIREKLHSSGYTQPLIADVHFNPTLAFTAAMHADKVRINPGNFSNRKSAQQNLETLVGICQEHGTAIRVGTNMGSLSKETIKTYGINPLALVKETMAFLTMLEQLGFYNTVVSLKASHPAQMVQACRMMAEKMTQNGRIYPMHIGVTEAGNGLAGRIKSAMGIGALLKSGIGSTIRVSLTEPPENEIPVARQILRHLTAKFPKNTIVDHDTITITCHSESAEAIAIMAACDLGDQLLSGQINQINIEAPNLPDQSIIALITQLLLQAAGQPNQLTEFISCPSCARNTIHVENILQQVKAYASNIPGLKLAVMGCIVNGPGEMVGASYGILGAGDAKVWIYKNGVPVRKNIPQIKAADTLKELLLSDGILARVGTGSG